ncbi:HNH endonuclease [Planobispora rosea]|uniref:HNH endonuclease n=1 Tax=Planobispora rosea TaxID=35762 RepID=UPI000A0653E4|nr:HNH endonuclease signature motif containing protein [Planobispora rosea]
MTSTRKPNARRRQEFKRQLAKRDGAVCFYCADPFADLAAATLDHLVPSSRGGTWARANLVLACEPCNQAKADRLPSEVLRPTSFRPGLRPSRPAVLRQYAAATLARLTSVRRAASPLYVGPVRPSVSPGRPRRTGAGQVWGAGWALLALVALFAAVSTPQKHPLSTKAPRQARCRRPRPPGFPDGALPDRPDRDRSTALGPLSAHLRPART